MKDLPSNRTRYRAALAVWIVFTVVFAGLLIYRLFVEPNDSTWVGVFAIGSFVGVWRWIAEARKRQHIHKPDET